MTLLEKRDSILDSLRTQFRCRVLQIVTVNPLDNIPRAYAVQRTPDGAAIIPDELDKLLLDMANNAAQGLAEDDPDVGRNYEGVTSW
jgi:hypothetical protein